MKTDTDDTIRVTITLRRQSHPEWYAVLSKVRSGRDRAEIVRTHLTLPRPAAMALVGAPAGSLDRSESKVSERAGAASTPAVRVFDSKPKANSLYLSDGKTGEFQQDTSAPKNTETPSEKESISSRDQSEPRARGLASVLLDANLGPSGKS